MGLRERWAAAPAAASKGSWRLGGLAVRRCGSVAAWPFGRAAVLAVLDVALEGEERFLESREPRGRGVEHGLDLLQVERHHGLGGLGGVW